MSFSTLTEALEVLIGSVFLIVFCLFLIALYAEESCRSREAVFTNERRAPQRLEREAALIVLIDSKSRATLKQVEDSNRASARFSGTASSAS